MDARSGLQWIVAIFAILAEFSFLTLTISVYAYDDGIVLQVSSEPDSSQAWIDKTVIGIPKRFLNL